MTGKNPSSVKIGRSLEKNETSAAYELYEKIKQEDMDAILFFCSSSYDLDVLGDELKRCFHRTIIGCTTAGEISSEGYQENGITAASFPSSLFSLYPLLISPVSGFGAAEVKTLVDSLHNEPFFTEKKEHENIFGFLLIDGLSIAEERIIALLSSQLQRIPITGGSAGDNLIFKETKVYLNGAFHSDCAVLTFFKTSCPFHMFETHHFRPTEQKLVITNADPSRRLVFEINGEPAVQAYADAAGVSPEELSLKIFSKHPVMLKVGETWYIRAISKLNSDGSLTFYSAIDTGLVLTLGEAEDMVGNLKATLSKIAEEIPEPAVILGCDCILRKLEAQDKNLLKDLNAALRNVPFLGFSTYGEQTQSVHVNQTLTGIAIGKG